MSKIPMLNDQALIDQLPGHVLWKDTKSVYLRGNVNIAKLLGFKRADELVGITDYDIRCGAAEHADLFVQEDQKFLSMYNGTPFQILCIARYADDQLKAVLVNKSLFFDDNGEPLGTVNYGVTLNNQVVKDINILFNNYALSKDKQNQVMYYLNSEYNGMQLSTRQAQCLFYILRGKTSKEIAKILQLSSRTVEDYFDNIKIKMDCTNKAQVIEKAIDLGFLEIVPPGIGVASSFIDAFKL